MQLSTRSHNVRLHGQALGCCTQETLQPNGGSPAEHRRHPFSTVRNINCCMVETRRSAGRHKYSVLLPTYNEADNIAIIIWLIIRSFEQWRAPCTPQNTCSQHMFLELERAYSGYNVAFL